MRPLAYPSWLMFLPQPRFGRPFSRPFRRPCRTVCVASKRAPKQAVGLPRLRTPYDLVHFRRSRFAAHFNELRRRRKLPPDAEPDPPTRLDRALSAAGQAHEKRVIDHLRRLLPDAELCEIPFGHPDRYALTAEAIRDGKPLIQGAALRDDLFSGYADLLIHASVDPFSTGSGYAVCEIKLASLQTADFTIQAAVYATMLNHLQHRLGLATSTYSYLWLGSPESEPKKLAFRTLDHFFRRVSSEYRQFLNEFTPSPIPQPDGPLDSLRPWTTYASKLLESSDSLRLIAGIRRSQAKEIETTTGAKTLAEYASCDEEKVKGLVRHRVLAPFHLRLHTQARMQYETRVNGETAFTRLSETPKGMPKAAVSDSFFDMEGFPLLEGGLEYLFGVSSMKGFHSWWAHTRHDEEKAFVQLMTHFVNVLDVEDDQVQPHIFHYGHYEVTALKRVAMRAVTADGIEAALIFEQLVERDLFFDVYDFVRTSLVVGEPSYSIKKVEKLVGVSRDGDELADAESSVGMYYEWRSTAFSSDTKEFCGSYESHPILHDILHYNRQDCESLKDVVVWLRYQFPPIPSIDVSEVSTDTHHSTEDEEITNQILPGACGRSVADKVADSEVILRSSELGVQIHHKPISSLSPLAKQNLSHLLQFYVRESLPVRHAFRRRVDNATGSVFDELYQDDKCLAAVRFVRATHVGPPSKEKKVYIYNFDMRQPTSLAEGETIAFVGSWGHPSAGPNSNTSVNGFMTVKSLKGSDRSIGEVTLAPGKKDDGKPLSFGSLISTEDLKICDAPLRNSILRKSEILAQDSSEPTISLARAFLNRDELGTRNEDQGQAVSFCSGNGLCAELSKFLVSQEGPNVFVIQGPPGSGKTYLSARLIHNLVHAHNKTVAVSSNSHYAVDKLLYGAAEVGVDKDVIFKVGKRPDDKDKVRFKANIRDLDIVPVSNENVHDFSDPASRESPGRKRNSRQNNRGALVGATCYQLAQEQCDGKFDFLFVDEASQVTVANFLSMSGSAKYAVLVGDQQQLQMPIKGLHPDDVGVSCLSYAVGEGVSIVRPSRGIFLDKSYRMNPEICSFVSESFYDNALKSADECSGNRIVLTSSKNTILNTGSGVQFVPSDSSFIDFRPETKETHGKWHRPLEVAVLQEIVQELLGLRYETRKVSLSEGRTLGVDDILVVAPYNAQVRALQSALPEGLRVGTVDKFQGQEAPVVLVSLCAGEMEDKVVGSLEQDEESLEKPLVEEQFSGVPQNSSAQRRGLKFALQRNRLNVAISRAECLAVVTGQSTACSRMSLNSYEDVETAALYESLQFAGAKMDRE